jgi:hypothetical protein
LSESVQGTCSDSLSSFCAGIVSRYGNAWPPTEQILAEECISLFPISAFPQTEDLKQFGANLGIEVSIRAMPADIPGYNCFYEQKRQIILGEREVFPGVVIHSFFHEIRDYIEHVFKDLGCPTAFGKGLEDRAEGFATAIRLISSQETLASLEGIADISSNWYRWGAYALCFMLAFIQLAGCAALPYFENHASQRK